LILLLTDGFEEALSPEEEFFGMKRVLDHIKAHQDDPAEQIVRTLYHNFRQFTEGAMQLDDLTIVVVKVGEAR
jgi:serine phosphatase RsbU (regulator of sigma subunit)